MSTSTIPNVVASLAAEVGPVNSQAAAGAVVHGYQRATTAAAAFDAHVPLGNGVGVKQVIVENWRNVPFVFMINTNDELYYGYQTTATASTAPWNSYTAFSGWTFITGAAKEITVEFGQNNNPYIYLINSKDNLYYGNLSPSTGVLSNQSVFSGWTFLTGAAKHVSVGQWQGNSYIYLINSNDELYFGNLYTTRATTFPPVPSQTLFSGWNFITGAAKQVTVDLWRGYPYLYLINSNDELYYGNLYFAPNTPPPPIGQATFSGWNFITGAAKSVTINQRNGSPYLYLINSNDELYYGSLSPAANSTLIPPGPSKFSGWTFVSGAVTQVSVSTWQNNTLLYIINTNNDLYYGYWYTAYAETSRWTYTPYTVFSGWNFITGAAKKTVVNLWQNKSFVYLVNSNNDLFFSNLYTATSNVPPWKPYIAFSGWSPF